MGCPQPVWCVRRTQTDGSLLCCSHRPALGECVASFASTFPVAFLEPQLNKHNPHSILYGIEDDQIATFSLEAKGEPSSTYFSSLCLWMEVIKSPLYSANITSNMCTWHISSSNKIGKSNWNTHILLFYFLQTSVVNSGCTRVLNPNHYFIFSLFPFSLVSCVINVHCASWYVGSKPRNKQKLEQDQGMWSTKVRNRSTMIVWCIVHSCVTGPFLRGDGRPVGGGAFAGEDSGRDCGIDGIRRQLQWGPTRHWGHAASSLQVCCGLGKWCLSVMNNYTYHYGCIPVWLLPVVDYIPLWLIHIVASFCYDYFPLSLLPVITAFYSRYGYFLL